jgi:hypothetical protein
MLPCPKGRYLFVARSNSNNPKIFLDPLYVRKMDIKTLSRMLGPLVGILGLAVVTLGVTKEMPKNAKGSSAACDAACPAPVAEQRGTEQAPVFLKGDLTTHPVLEKTDAERETERRKVENDAALTYWTKVLGLFTIALAVVAGVQAYLFIRQLKVTQRALEDSRDAANAAKVSADAAKASADALPKIERAYLFVEVRFNPAFQPHPAGGYRATIEVVFTNHGKTPAILTRLRAYAITLELAPTELGDHSKADKQMPKGIVVGAGLQWTWAIPCHVDRDHYTALNDVVQRIYCLGVVDYDDVLGSHRRTGFCWQSYPENDVVKFTIAPVDVLNHFS